MSPVSCILGTLHTLYTCTLHTLYTCTLHTLYTYTLHTLYTYTLHTLYTCTVHTLYTCTLHTLIEHWIQSAVVSHQNKLSMYKLYLHVNMFMNRLTFVNI